MFLVFTALYIYIHIRRLTVSRKRLYYWTRRGETHSCTFRINDRNNNTKSGGGGGQLRDKRQVHGD